MAGSEAPGGSRIAIKFGNASSSSASKGSRRPSPPSSLGKRQRSHHALNPDSDSEDDTHTQGKHELVTSIGGSNTHAPKSREDRTPLKIAPLPNRDWKSEARGRRGDNAQPNKKPRSAQKTQEDKKGESTQQDAPLQWGLSINKSRGESNSAQAPKKDRRSETNGSKSQRGTEDREKSPGPVGSDEEAANHLTGKKESNVRRRVIEGQGDSVTEDVAFQRDFRNAPDESTLEDYEAMPVEDFGAAVLLGQGWDGKFSGPKVKQVKRRANQLGLGAKELTGEEDLGKWNQKGSRDSRPPKLSDYKREEDKRREKRDDRHRDSYKQERDRERRDRDRDSHGHRHRDRHHAR